MKNLLFLSGGGTIIVIVLIVVALIAGEIRCWTMFALPEVQTTLRPR